MRSPDLTEFLELSARLGRDPLRVQASSGNTSIKLGGELWIKASGKWLAHAMDEAIMVPLNLREVRRGLRQGAESFCARSGSATGSNALQPSIETAMHAVLPHRIVIHTHSVSTIAWAVRADDAERLAERLEGLSWQCIPYTPSGLPLARAIEQAITAFPRTDVFVLANHGLVVCGDTCESAERLLGTVESCLEVTPRRSTMGDQKLKTDEVSLRILEAGILYPCQAIFLGQRLDLVEEHFSQTQLAVLNGLLEVARRIPEDAPVRYLSQAELADLLTVDAHAYKRNAELSGTRSVEA